MTNAVDTPDPADMARWLRERKEAVVEFLKLDSEDQQRQFLNRWQQNVLPHLAFRFVQAAEMIERLAEDCRELIAERDGLNAKVCELLKQLHHEPRVSRMRTCFCRVDDVTNEMIKSDDCPTHGGDRTGYDPSTRWMAIAESADEHPLRKFCTCPLPGTSNSTIDPFCPIAFPHPWTKHQNREEPYA